MIFQQDMDLMEKLTILSDAAKYDAACTSSGVDKKNNGSGIGNTKACGICHSFAADGRCISLLKILFTNECIYNCRYCINRSSNDVVRATFTPEEVCTLTMEFYKRNYIEGLFLSSGIIQNPDYTMQLLSETVMLLRQKYHFGGYIHLKGIPGASENLIEMAGWYADRMSVNLELPTADGLKHMAPAKTRKNILRPMRQIQQGILRDGRQPRLTGGTSQTASAGAGYSEYAAVLNGQEADLKAQIAESAAKYNLGKKTNTKLLEDVCTKEQGALGRSADGQSAHSQSAHSQSSIILPHQQRSEVTRSQKAKFVPAGQSTQMIIGATKENDYQIMTVSEALYQQYDLKRVFYSAFINVNQDSELPAYENGAPLLREHRLYQADWLLRFYGFRSSELLTEARPNFNVLLDPKCDWAIRHLELFPVEINKADYYTLLRVPGLGVKSAQRIMKARRSAVLDFPDIKKMGVVLKRALYFITCSGRMMYYPTKLEENYITNGLIGIDNRRIYEIEHHQSYQQLSLFDTVSMGG